MQLPALLEGLFLIRVPDESRRHVYLGPIHASSFGRDNEVYDLFLSWTGAETTECHLVYH